MALSMRRILFVLSVALVMAAMMVVTAVPAFADPGGKRGHTTVDPETGEYTFAGGSGGGNGSGSGGQGGRYTINTDKYTIVGGYGTRGGGGGGQCEIDFSTGFPIYSCPRGSL
jgi:uncharacterized membrane protein